MTIEERLKQMEITLPSPPLPVANFLPLRRSGNLVFLSGQGPIIDDEPLFHGKLGVEVSEAEGYRAARFCGLNLLAHLCSYISLDDVAAIVGIRGYVASADNFLSQPAVINGCSDLLVEVFGDIGRHSRCAIGVNILPGNIPVEIEMVVEVIDDLTR